MKALIAAALLFGIGASAATNSITTLAGKIYSNAVIQRADADGLVIHYRPDKGTVGIAKVKFRDLDELTQKRYGYDPANALAFERNQEQVTARRAAERDATAINIREREYRLAVERRKRNDLADQRAAELAEQNRKQEEAARLEALRRAEEARQQKAADEAFMQRWRIQDDQLDSIDRGLKDLNWNLRRY